MSRKICITAADGHTGIAIVELLFGELFSKKFDSITAMVLDPKSEHAIRAKELGAQVVHHEPGRERDVAKALQDSQCDTLCLIPPAHKDKKLITYELIRASKKVEIPNVLFISSAGCDFADPRKQPRLREFIEMETKFLATKGDNTTATGTSPCIIRTGFYAENILLYAPQVVEEALFPLPIGSIHKFAPVALGDVANLSAHILTGKGKHGFDYRHRGQMMVVTGPELCAGEELTTAASQALGVTMQFEDIAEAEAEHILKAQSESDQSELQYLLEYYSLVREGKTNYIATCHVLIPPPSDLAAPDGPYTTTAFVNVTGAHPTTPTEFFKMYGSELKRPKKRIKRNH